MRTVRGHSYGRNRSGNEKRVGYRPFQGNEIRCFVCNKTGHKAAQCYNAGKVCNQCGRKGHMAAACRSKDTRGQKAPPAQRRGKVKCWGCGREGHTQNQCRSTKGPQQQNRMQRKPPGATVKQSNEAQQDKKPPSTAARQWLKEQEAKLELPNITPELIKAAAEIRRLVNIEIDARVAARKVAIKIDKMFKEAKTKVKDRFFIRTTGEWHEVEREASTKADLLQKQRNLKDAIELDAEMARIKANEAVDKMIESLKSKRGSTPFTNNELEKMPKTLCFALKQVYDISNQQLASEIGQFGDRAIQCVAAWYTKIIATAKELMQLGYNEVEKNEAAKIAREQARVAARNMEVDEPEGSSPRSNRRRTEAKWTPTRGKSKPSHQGSRK